MQPAALPRLRTRLESAESSSTRSLRRRENSISRSVLIRIPIGYDFGGYASGHSSHPRAKLKRTLPQHPSSLTTGPDPKAHQTRSAITHEETCDPQKQESSF